MLRAHSSRLTLLLCAAVFAVSQAPWPALASSSFAATHPISCASHTMQMCCCRPGARHDANAACPMQPAAHDSTATPCLLKPADCNETSMAPLQVSSHDELPLVVLAVLPAYTVASTAAPTASARPLSVALDPPFVPPKSA